MGKDFREVSFCAVKGKNLRTRLFSLSLLYASLQKNLLVCVCLLFDWIILFCCTIEFACFWLSKRRDYYSFKEFVLSNGAVEEAVVIIMHLAIAAFRCIKQQGEGTDCYSTDSCARELICCWNLSKSSLSVPGIGSVVLLLLMGRMGSMFHSFSFVTK